MLDLNQRFILNTDIVIRGVGEKYWALNVKDGTQYRLNSTSFALLNALHEEKSLNDLIGILSAEFAVEYDRLINDCNVIIPFAMDKQLIKEVIL